MSAYITLMTPMMDEGCLLLALADLGFGANQTEVHREPVHLVGFRGDSRAQRASVVIRRHHLGTASNDIGFVLTPTGYSAVISNYDKSRFGSEWLSKVFDRYQYHEALKRERLAEAERRRLEEERRRLVEAERALIVEKAKKLGYMVKESRENETVRLVLLKRTY